MQPFASTKFIAAFALVVTVLITVGCGERAARDQPGVGATSNASSGVLPSIGTSSGHEGKWLPVVASTNLQVLAADVELGPATDEDRKSRPLDRVFWKNPAKGGWAEGPPTGSAGSGIGRIAVRGNEVMAATAQCRPGLVTDAEARCSAYNLRLLAVGSDAWREVPFPSGIDPAFTFGLWGSDVGWLYAASSNLDAPLQWFLATDGTSWKPLRSDQAPTRSQVTVSGSMCVLRSGAIVAWSPTVKGAVDPTTHLSASPDQLTGTSVTRWQLGTDRRVSVEGTDWALGFACTGEAVIGSVIPRGQTAANTIARLDLDTLAPVELTGTTVGRPFRAWSQVSSGNSVLKREDRGVIRCTDEQCTDVVQVPVDLAPDEQILGDLGNQLVISSADGLRSVAV